MLRVAPEELLEAFHQGRHVERASFGAMPPGIEVQAFLKRVGQLARNHLAVDRVGDANGRVTSDQAEIANVLQVAAGELVPLASHEQRFDDPPDPRLAQLVCELV